MHRVMIAAAAGGLLMMSFTLSRAEAAPPAPASTAAQPTLVTPVAQGFRGGGMRGGGIGIGRGVGRGMGIGRPHIGAGRGLGPGRGFRGGTALRGGAPRAYRGVGRRHGHHGHHHHHHHHRRFFYAAPFVGYGAYYYGDRYYGSGCGWLRRRAEATGSRYWWSRYEDCLDENS